MKKNILIAALILLTQAICFGQSQADAGKSIYQARLDDPDAVYFTPENFSIKTDGKTDVSDALQQAITDVKTKYNFGIVFIPEGKYLISKTIFIPTAVRLIGYGKNRPQIILAKNSPGFQTADSTDKGKAKYMFWFVSNLSKPGEGVHDAGASTFYSAINNINLKIENGNPAAVAMRAHFAQHSFVGNVDVNIGNGKAGMFDVGNAMNNVRFFGGQYGIYTTKPSPGWQFMMVDTYFEGQREAAIKTQEGGLTIVRLRAKNVPTVISINPNYHEKLFMENCRFDKVSGPAIIISNEENAFNQVSLKNIDCRNVPIFASYRRSGKQTPGKSGMYKVKRFIDGLQMDSLAADPVYKTINEVEPLTVFPEPVKSDIPELPAINTWANLKTLGARGDGTTDDTQIIQDAIDKYATIYVPQGWYRVSETIKLKPNTALIGLNPIATQFIIADNTPSFGGFGGPKALLESAKGGANILTGIGLSTSADNPRAVACKWMSGADSYLNDVKFIGGHGGLEHPAKPGEPKKERTGIYAKGYNGADPSWDTQYWSLWVTNGGGGTFMNIWTANTFATNGAYFSNTTTPSHVYALSVEHHVRNEVRFNNVSNFNVYALQLEEESRESTECQPLEVENCINMVFANLYTFRVIRVNKPAPYAIREWGGKNVEFLNVHNYSQIKYTTTNPLYDINNDYEVRPWEFARLLIDDNNSKPSGDKITKLATGFEFAIGACTDSKGNIYFCEQRMKRIYKWSAASRTMSLLADYPWEPESLACDKNDNLLVVFKYLPKPGYLVNGKPEEFKNPPDASGTSFSGWGNSGFGTLVYAVDPNNPDETIQILKKAPMGSVNPIYKALYPAHRWRDYHDFNTISVARPTECFVAPDGVTIIPVVYDLARSTALAAAYPGKTLYTTDEYDKRTVTMSVSPDGYVSDLKYFTERGEFANATDDQGNVYIADGQIYVYNSAGKQINVIKVPERPTSLTFGKDKRLYVTSHNSLFEIKIN